MKFFATLATGFALISSLSAAPANLPSDLLVRGNTCPPVSEIEEWIKVNRKNVGPKTVFYTGSGTNRDAMYYANKIGGASYWGNVFDDDNAMDKWFADCGAGPEQEKLFPRMAEALARATTGQAYLMLPKGETLKSDSIWMKNEYPALQGRVPVTAVNPSKVEETLANWTPNSVWKRGFEFDGIVV